MLDAASFIRLHLNHKTATIPVDLPIIGNCSVLVLPPFEREGLDELDLIAKSVEGGLERDRLAVLLTIAETQLLADRIRKELENVSPNLSANPERFEDIRALVLKGLEDVWLEDVKLAFCESPTEYFGRPVNQISDVQWLIWRAARMKGEEKQRRNNG